MTETKSIQAGERTQHTPGPWKAIPEDKYGPEQVVAMNGTVAIARIYPTANDERNANARLIAAAPELLDACREVEADLLAYNTEDVAVLSVERVSELRGMLLAVIAKAEGK